MTAVHEILERCGCFSEADAPRLDLIGSAELDATYESLYGRLLEEQYARPAAPDTNMDPFTFIAGANMRGDLLSCGELGCRVAKLDFLARYAALYATEVTVPLPLVAPEKTGSISERRRLLFAAAVTILQLRPLIDTGIIKLAVMQTSHCEHTADWARMMMDLVHQVADEMAGRIAPRFNVVFEAPDKSPSGQPTIYVSGPAEFLDEDMILLLPSDSKFQQKIKKLDSRGRANLVGGPRLSVVKQISNAIASETTFYMAYGRIHRARFLSDLSGETRLLDWLARGTGLRRSSAMMRRLYHAVPILNELPVATLVRIRSEEWESFDAYRRAVTEITEDVMRSNGSLSGQDVEDALRSRIEPELARIHREIALEKKRQRRRVIAGVASVAAGVAIGAVSGLPLPATAAVAGASAVVGSRLLGKAAESACEHGADMRERDDLYFLVRLLNEAN